MPKFFRNRQPRRYGRPGYVATCNRSSESITSRRKQSGSYGVEVVSLTKDAPPGRYEVKVAALRAATAQDHQWIVAQSTYAKGQQLRGQGTAESRRQSVERYQEAMLNWRTVGDRVMETHALYGIGLAYRSLGQPQKAMEYYNQALQLQRLGEGRPELANTLFIIGLIHHDRRRDAAAN